MRAVRALGTLPHAQVDAQEGDVAEGFLFPKGCKFEKKREGGFWVMNGDDVPCFTMFFWGFGRKFSLFRRCVPFPPQNHGVASRGPGVGRPETDGPRLNLTG